MIVELLVVFAVGMVCGSILVGFMWVMFAQKSVVIRQKMEDGTIKTQHVDQREPVREDIDSEKVAYYSKPHNIREAMESYYKGDYPTETEVR